MHIELKYNYKKCIIFCGNYEISVEQKYCYFITTVLLICCLVKLRTHFFLSITTEEILFRFSHIIFYTYTTNCNHRIYKTVINTAQIAKKKKKYHGHSSFSLSANCARAWISHKFASKWCAKGGTISRQEWWYTNYWLLIQEANASPLHWYMGRVT